MKTPSFPDEQPPKGGPQRFAATLERDGRKSNKPVIIKIRDGVYCAHGYALANVLLVVTGPGVVVIDTTESLATAHAVLRDFRKVCQLPISYIIYTHHHGDHIRGAKAFLSASTRVISQRRMPEERAKVALLLQHRTRTDRLQFGLALEENERGISHATLGESGYVPPDITFDTEHSFEEGGVRFELYHAAGESVDHVMIWLPEEKVLFPGDLFYDSFPMLANPLKPERPVLEWAESLDQMRALRPEYLVPSHGLPLSGADEIEATLSNYAGAIRYVHDQTVELLNRGLTLEEIKRRVRLPKQWRKLSYLQPKYGSIEWAVCGIFRHYTGWYDLNPTHLNPIPTAMLSRTLIGVSGGVNPLLKRAREAMDKGEDQLALELTDIVLRARPRNRAAQVLRVRALQRLGRLSTNRVAQNVYRSAARSAQQQIAKRDTSQPELSHTPRIKPQERSQPPVFILAAPRSYTSVVCAMLGQHPEMYGMPELHLFKSETMAEWFELCRSESFPRAHGMLRAVAQLFFGEQTEETIRLARRWLKARSNLTTGQLLRTLAVKMYPAIPVEKSPSVHLGQDSLTRAYRMFPRARFIHLVRHPKGQGESVMNYMKVRAQYGPIPPSHWLVYLASYGEAAGKGNHPDPQHAWYALNQSICTFLQSVPGPQQRTVRGEDLLSDPDEAFVPILEWLGVRSDSEAIERMKHPEASPYACLGPKGAEFGNDRLFLQSPALRHDRAPKHGLEGPVSWRTDRAGLVSEVIELAAKFGYQ